MSSLNPAYKLIYFNNFQHASSHAKWAGEFRRLCRYGGPNDSAHDCKIRRQSEPSPGPAGLGLDMPSITRLILRLLWHGPQLSVSCNIPFLVRPL